MLHAIVLVVIFIIAGILSCRHEPEDLSEFPRVCFDTEVLPIFQASCGKSGCHNGNDEEEYNFTNFEGIMAAIVPGSPLESPAYNSIAALWGEEAMPPDQPLSEESRMIIRLWIEQGAERIICSNTPGTNPQGPVDSTWVNPRACFQRDILPVIQSNCAISGCHSGTNAQGGIYLENYQDVSLVASNGMLMGVVTGEEGYVRMPPGSSSSSCRISQIRQWINDGFPDNYC